MRMASDDAKSAPSELEGAGLVPATAAPLPVAPVAGAQAAESFAGQINVIDPWIYTNFVQAPTGEFTVSPRNTPGEVLVNLEIGPNLNPYLQHLAQMYNGYAGGVEVQVILAGNAFTAGKLLCALVPPGFPTSSITPAQLTMLPHTIIDVRTTDPVVVPMPDVRRTLWHEVRSTTEPLMRLVIMLYTPMRANSGSDEAFVVSGRVLSRPAPDFNFFYLVPPRVEDTVEPFSLPDLRVDEMSSSRWQNPIVLLQADPNQNIAAHWQNGRCTINGELLGTTPRNQSWLLRMRGSVLAAPGGQKAVTVNVDLTEPDGQAFSVLSGNPGPEGVPDFQAIYNVRMSTASTTAGHTVATNGYIEQSGYTPALGTLVIQGVDLSKVPALGSEVTMQVVSIDLNHNMDPTKLPDYNGAGFDGSVALAPPLVPPLPGEVLLRFTTLPITTSRGSSVSATLDCALPAEWITWFLVHNFVPQGDAALLRYRNRGTGQILFECKLYKEGFLAVAGVSTRTVFPTSGVFEFVSWVPVFYQLTPVGSSGARKRQR